MRIKGIEVTHGWVNEIAVFASTQVKFANYLAANNLPANGRACGTRHRRIFDHSSFVGCCFDDVIFLDQPDEETASRLRSVRRNYLQ